MQALGRNGARRRVRRGRLAACSTAEKRKWDVLGVFNGERYQCDFAEPPFTRIQVAGGLALWNLLFVSSGIGLRQLVSRLPPLHTNLDDASQQAWLIALLSFVQLSATAASARSLTHRHGLNSKKTDGSSVPWLDLSPHCVRDALSLKDGWLTWALLGLVGSPFAVLGASVIASQLGLAQDGSGTTVQPLMPLLGNGSAAGPSILVPLGSSIALSSPLMEELVFRGVLLPSVTRWSNTPAAVVVASLAFTANHTSVQSAPQLLALSLILGFSYVRTRNLLTPLIIHSAWNTVVFTVVVSFPELVFQAQQQQ
jgi:membrane protease YdiL (CAAX protease family)